MKFIFFTTCILAQYTNWINQNQNQDSDRNQPKQRNSGPWVSENQTRGFVQRGAYPPRVPSHQANQASSSNPDCGQKELTLVLEREPFSFVLLGKIYK